MDTWVDHKPAQKDRWEALRSVLAAQHDAPPLVPRLSGAATPASFAQRRFWFLEVLDPNTPAHTLTVAHRLTGALNAVALERALSELVRRHEALRTTLTEGEDAEIVQIVHAAAPLVPTYLDLRALASDEREAAVQAHTDAEAARPFDLESGPLLRAVLLLMGEQEHQLVVSVHHAVFDGWSFDIFMEELGVLYGAFAAGFSSPISEPTLQYADATLWQRQRLQGAALDRMLNYWTGRMAPPPPVLTLPTDRPRHRDRDRRGASRKLTLAPEVTRALKGLAESNGVTLFTALLTGFHILLHRHTGETDIVVGSPVANRHRAELTQMIGPLVNTLPLRVSLNGDPTIRDLLARAAEAVHGGFAHQDLPFELIVEAVNPTRLADHPPLAQVVFAFQNVPRTGWSLPGLDTTSWPLDSRRVTHDLTLYMQEAPAGLIADLHYDSSLFDAATADALLGRFATLPGGMVMDPGQRVATLPLLTSAERARLQEWNATAVPYPDRRSIHGLYAEQARAMPDAIAVAGHDGSTLSYSELDRRANRLARHLRALGVAAEARVGVRLGRSPARIVTLLAILKTGGVYVPLDPAVPAQPTAERLRDVEAAVLVTDGVLHTSLTAALAAARVAVLHLDAARTLIEYQDDSPFDANIPAAGLACVLSTSGSTGGEKAVAVTHRGVVRMARGMGEAAPNASDVLLHLAPLSFDAATFEIWGALLNGARLALAPDEAPTPEVVEAAIRRHGVTQMWLTAGLFEVIVDLRAEALTPLQRLLVGGDVVSPVHAARLLALAPTCKLFNGYGPTEATTFTCLHPITADELTDGGPIPIGRPIANTRMHVLDAALQPVPIGVPGEAWIGGDGLARGYLNDPDLTSERFIPDPFDPSPGARLYRSGDRVRQRADGVIEFIGRVDGQVKIGGVRVETGAVETALLRCPGVSQAAVMAVGEGAAGKHLAAWIVPVPGADPLPGLRQRLRAWLPEAMIPAGFAVLDRLPLTANGKLDRRALPPPDIGADGDGNTQVPPRDAMEGTLLALFEELLDVRPLGIHDSFFGRGGDSLLAVQLVHHIEEAFGDAPPLLSVFETPTVAGLAEELRAIPRRLELPDDATRVTVRRGDPARPIFLVPGGHGGMVEMALYARLLRRLEGNPMVHGLRARGMDGSTPLPPSVAAMAASHLDVVRRIQPAGPYRIVGECVGAAVAFEMARQLTEQGETVAALVLLDGWCPSRAGQRHYEWLERPLAIFRARRPLLPLAWAHLSAIFQDHRKALIHQSWRQRRHQMGEAVCSLWRVLRHWIPSLTAIASPQPCPTAAAERAYVHTLMSYRPRRYPGVAALVASEDSLRQGIAEGWRPWVGGLTIHPVPGNHDTYLREHVEVTLARVDTCLGTRL